jgi:hypothetical protein
MDYKIDEDFTLDGLPRHTRQTRYKDHSGFGAKVELDHFDRRTATTVTASGPHTAFREAERPVLLQALRSITTRWAMSTS